jgi:TatD DNase family protein
MTFSCRFGPTRFAIRHACRPFKTLAPRKMGKNKRTNTVPGEEHLLLPPHPFAINRASESGTRGFIDTHTHIASTFATYRSKYKEGKYETAIEFFRAMCEGRRVEAVVDVWCEAPVQKVWKEFADLALIAEDRERIWGGINYWFVMGENSAIISKLDADGV